MATTANRLGKTVTLPFIGSVLLLAGFFLPWFDMAPLLDDPAFILETIAPLDGVIDTASIAADPRTGLNVAATPFGIATPVPERFSPPQLIAFAQEVESAVNDPPFVARMLLTQADMQPELPERAWMLNILWVIPAMAALGLVLCLLGRRPRVTPVPAALLALVVIIGVLYGGATYEAPTGLPVLGWDRMLAVQGVGAWISIVGSLLVLAGALLKGRTGSA